MLILLLNSRQIRICSYPLFGTWGKADEKLKPVTVSYCQMRWISEDLSTQETYTELQFLLVAYENPRLLAGQDKDGTIYSFACKITSQCCHLAKCQEVPSCCTSALRQRRNHLYGAWVPPSCLFFVLLNGFLLEVVTSLFDRCLITICCYSNTALHIFVFQPVALPIITARTSAHCFKQAILPLIREHRKQTAVFQEDSS